MATLTQPFNRLLEHYLYSVANQCIHCADNQTQAQLINLISRVNMETSLVGDELLMTPTDLTDVEQEVRRVAGISVLSIKNRFPRNRKKEDK
ncbi:hypothetical protein [Spirosoma foliorum]|uniref:Uncharacterized protein n=1 Tax=Spirosoma foliorum TaxID=2710596 RepID=A0A7G5GQ73_9BACT|nr:hypothetical protein [Spirosoma foliorum]QMW01015.1 hypothetical protein H3H32_23975 [Spirosoma foliorum]